MKKTALIFTSLVILVIFLLPLIGNRFMQKYIDENIQSLQSQGFVLKKSTKDAGYLNTKQHFEFVLKNTDVFENYVNAYTKTKFPASLYALLQDATIGVDVTYSNILFSKAVTIEIYPLRLSETVMQNIKANNLDAYKQFLHFLQSQGILYHIEYNVLSQDFSGFIKDIDEKYDLKKNSSLLFQLQGSNFTGNGNLFAPNKLRLNLHLFKLELRDDLNRVVININDLYAKTDFDSFSKYVNHMSLFHVQIAMQSSKDDISIVIDDLDTTSSSSAQNNKVNLHSQSFIQNIALYSKRLNFKLKSLHSDVSVEALDKQSYEKFAQLLAESKTMNKTLLQKQMQNRLLSLLSHGLHVKIKELSLQNIIVDNEELDGMKIQSDIRVKEDKDLVAKGKISPMFLLSDITLDMKIKLAKALYLKIIENSPMAPLIVSYAKKDAQNVYFDILFRDTQLMINDKIVR